jgi:hydroxyacylglutathione hydrolase
VVGSFHSFLCCSAHEYTSSNAKFAASVEPGNTELMERVAKVNEMRARGEPTVPSLMGLEKKTNPFLRCDISQELRQNAGVVSGDSDADAFGKVRRAKDNFRG